MKNDSKFVRDSNSSLKLLTFQLSNVRELETIKYTFVPRPLHQKENPEECFVIGESDYIIMHKCLIRKNLFTMLFNHLRKSTHVNLNHNSHKNRADTPVAFQTHEKNKWSCFAVILLGRWRMRYKIGYLISPKVNRYWCAQLIVHIMQYFVTWMGRVYLFVVWISEFSVGFEMYCSVIYLYQFQNMRCLLRFNKANNNLNVGVILSKPMIVSVMPCKAWTKA